MINVRRAELTDATAIGAVHVAAWRSAYPGILPDDYLAKLSPTRLALHYRAAIASGAIVMVAAAAPEIGSRVASGSGPRIVGFASAGPPRTPGLGDSEIETLYVLDDWRDRGVGRQMMQAAASQLSARGCQSVFVWVLRANPSRWFYQHLGGFPAAEGHTQVAGLALPQVAYHWTPITRLLTASDDTQAAP